MSAEDTSRPIRGDAHQHFWPQPTRFAYPWMTDEQAALRRPFGPEDLGPLIQAREIDWTVLVQTRSSLDETRDFLAIAERTDFVAGVVGWVDLTLPHVDRVLADLKSTPAGQWLVGIRHQVHDEPDRDWLLRSDVQRGLRAVQQAGLSYDLLLKPRELPAALQVARAFPDLRLVIDHIAKPRIRDGIVYPWRKNLCELARRENVYCKLSGIVTEADWKSWSPAQLRPYFDAAVEAFGPRRLMFGSDWPVCLVASDYARWVRCVRDYTAALSTAEQERIFGGTAIEAYNL